ncbi:MAG: serine/threonine-protein kinase, partial [Myxococcota bacterium]
MSPLPDVLNLPRPFGEYTLLRRLAVGGMAEVYIAKAKGIGGFERLVAIKVIHPRFSEDDHFVQMLVEEAKISVLLSHHNIVQCFDLGRIDETYFIVMEYIEGADAYRTLRKAKGQSLTLDFDICSFVVSKVCSALDYAHRKRDAEGRPLNIVHRDVSPQNVLLSYGGDVKLVDFGIAKAAMRGGQTEAGVIKGKYYYMSPEQAWGDPMDHRSDIFSAGIVLYELLTGQMLYQEESIPLLLDRVRKAEIPAPTARRGDIPAELSNITMKALAKEPEDRYQSAQEMSHDLRQFLYTIAPSFTPARLSELMMELFPSKDRYTFTDDTTNNRRASSGEGEPLRQTAELSAASRKDYAPSFKQSVIFDLEEDDSTRNEVLPYRTAPKPGPSATDFPDIADDDEEEETVIAGARRGPPADDEWDDATVVDDQGQHFLAYTGGRDPRVSDSPPAPAPRMPIASAPPNPAMPAPAMPPPASPVGVFPRPRPEVAAKQSPPVPPPPAPHRGRPSAAPGESRAPAPPSAPPPGAASSGPPEPS